MSLNERPCHTKWGNGEELSDEEEMTMLKLIQ